MTVRPENGPPAPYVGLRPFEFQEAALFYGRGEHIAEMVRTLRKWHFLAVVGSSGSGKSSLVRAGLLPAIAAGFMNGGEEAADWRFVIMRPGLDPYENLLRELLPKLAPGQSLDPELIEFRRQTLRGGPRGLVEAVADSLLPEPTRLVVLVDQFEEIFRFLERGGPSQRDDGSSLADRRNAAIAFVDMLLATTAERDPHVYVVLTMRSEYLGECEAFLGLSAAIAKSQFLTPRMTREQIQDIIERPILAVGGRIEPQVVTDLLNSLGTAQDQLPRVEHILLRMWNRARESRENEFVSLTPDDYREAGRFESALDQHAEQLYSELGPGAKPDQQSEKQRVAEHLFRSLAVRSSQGTLVRRLSSLGEVASIAGASEQIVAEVVEHFRQPGCNFLVATPSAPLTGKTTLDISHEALLRQWRRFADEWQEQEQRDASELRRLAELASLRKQNQGVGLLPAQDLERIGRWEKRVSPEWARRYVTEDARREALSFVEESQVEVKRHEEQRQKQNQQRRAFMKALAIILIAATGFSLWQMRRAQNAATKATAAAIVAEEAKAKAQEALTRSFARTIGVSADYEPPTPDERAALWELAELGPANAPVREKVIDHWFQTEESLDRALRRNAQGLHAAIGLNGVHRKRVAAKANEIPYDLAKANENTEAPNYDRLSTLVGKLAALAAEMEPKDAGDIATRSVRVLAGAMVNSEEKDSFQVSSLGGPLRALAARMESVTADNLAGSVAKLLEKLPETDSRLPTLARALAALAARMEPKKAESIAERGAEVLAKAMKKTDNSNDHRSDLGSALATLVGRMERKSAARVAVDAAPDLVRTLADRYVTDTDRLSSLGNTLAALATHMESKDVVSVAENLAEILESSQETDDRRLSSLGNTLAALAICMEPKDVTILAERLAKELERETDAGRQSGLGEALAALAGHMEPKDCASFAERGAKVLAKELERETDAGRQSDLGEALAALAARMKPKDCASFAERGAKVLAKELERETDAGRQSDLGKALAALAGHMEPKDWASFAERGATVLAKAMEEPRRISAIQQSELGNSLAGVVARMEAKQASNFASRGAEALATALEGPQEPYDYNLSSLGDALAALAVRTEPKARADIANRGAEVLFRVLENPWKADTKRVSTLGGTVAALAARMEPKEAANLAIRLVKALENRRGADASRQWNLGWAIGRLSQLFPSARYTQLTALSNILLKEVPGPPEQGKEESEERRQFGALCVPLSAQDLAEVLKWPVCVGEAQKIVLTELGSDQKTSRKFGGDLWKFVEQAPSLGIKDLDAPAKRPRIEDAIEELERLRGGSADKPSVPSVNNPSIP